MTDPIPPVPTIAVVMTETSFSVTVLTRATLSIAGPSGLAAAS